MRLNPIPSLMHRRRRHPLLGPAALLAALFLPGTPALYAAPPTVIQTNYHGWTNAYLITNGIAEVVVVPAVGRVMQFGFTGEAGVFWDNAELRGQVPRGDEPDWLNFGGDKAWPSPEADWPKFTNHDKWKPPAGFDGMPMNAKVDAGDVYLTSQVDPSYGMLVRRRIHLHARKPVLFVQTIFERVAGEPARIGVWVVTQFKDPVGIFLPAPPSSIFTNHYTSISPLPPPDLKIEKGLLWFARDTNASHKIGSDVDSLLWVGEKVACRVDSPRARKGEFPDNKSSVEVYTSADPLPYIELETFGPLRLMKPGDAIQRVNTYTLIRRKEKSPEIDARKILLK